MELFDPDGILSPWCNFLQFNSHVQCICWHQPSTTILWQGSATTIKTLRAHGTATLMQRTHRTCRVNYIPTCNSCRREPCSQSKVRLGPHSTCFRYVLFLFSFPPQPVLAQRRRTAATSSSTPQANGNNGGCPVLTGSSHPKRRMSSPCDLAWFFTACHFQKCGKSE